ncbi:hypothetical protein MATL_G00124440 [Megalops atlanticus]|uniref:Sodium channel regulatory subunit beta-3 n=1 Tax=Megalops atlanticus TaxID=7932 RepID=A0A9D3T447_MEGAT|nr:hypothetical protein MATL_G00124440 [Megalops atlanticus]
MTHRKLLLWSVLLSILCVRHCQAGCAEVDSLTEAVVGKSFLLGCISCKRREEVPASTTVDWHFRPQGETDFYHIFHYDHPTPSILHEDFAERLEWEGTEGPDVQIGAVRLHNVTLNDTGTFRCTLERTLRLPLSTEHVSISKEVELRVVLEANRELTAVISEIMMYVLIVGLQLWMIGVLIYCYRKVSAEREAYEARRALRQHNLPPDSKDNCDGVHLE